MVAPLVYAPNHQHFFNVRLDFAVDGLENTVQRCDIVVDPIDEANNPFENAFHVETKDLTHEKEARSNLCLEKSRTWKIVNKEARNYMGQLVGFKFIPGTEAPIVQRRYFRRERRAVRFSERLVA